MKDRIQFDKAIENGIFYWEDHYPDSHLFADANYLLTINRISFTFIA